MKGYVILMAVCMVVSGCKEDDNVPYAYQPAHTGCEYYFERANPFEASMCITPDEEVAWTTQCSAAAKTRSESINCLIKMVEKKSPNCDGFINSLREDLCYTLRAERTPAKKTTQNDAVGEQLTRLAGAVASIEEKHKAAYASIMRSFMEDTH